MSKPKKVISEAAERIVTIVKSRAGGTPQATVAAMRRLCRHEFGVPARPIAASLDFYGQVSGDIGGDNAVIIYNSNQPNRMQLRTLLHELAEYLAARDMPGLWDNCEGGARLMYAGCDAPEEIRHQVAMHVEDCLARDMGLEDVAPDWSLTEILRVIPLAPKYKRPRTEIERLPADE